VPWPDGRRTAAPGQTNSRKGAVMNFMRSGAYVIAAALIGAASISAARAQVLEEIVVTATKREQAIQDVGITINAFSGEQIRELGFEHSFDIAAMMPNVHLGGSIAGQTTQFTIRGVTQNDFTDSVESPIAGYVDDGYIAMSQGQTFSLFDVERVEVAKGPQGTLFGRNATGGLVHFITRKPTRELDGFVDATVAEEGQVRWEAALSGPLTEKMSGRIAMLYDEHEPILENRFPEQFDQIPDAQNPDPIYTDLGPRADLWDDKTLGLRGHLLFDFNEDVSLLLSTSYADTEISTGPYQSSPTMPVFDQQGRLVNTRRLGPNEDCEAVVIGVPGCRPGGIAALDGDFDDVRPRAGGDLFGYIDPDGGDLTFSGDFAYEDLNDFETTGVSANLGWDFEAFTFTSISDFKRFDKTVLMDVDAAPVPQSIFQSTADVDSFTQELRFNGDTERMRWVAGLYYLYIDNQTTNGLAFSADSPFSKSGFIFPFPIDGNNNIELETNSYSAFGQVDYSLTERWTLVGGLRVIQEEKDYFWEQMACANFTDIADPFNTATDTIINKCSLTDGTALFPLRPVPGQDPAQVTNPYRDDSSDTLWAGKLQGEFRPNDDWLWFLGVNRGVKAGSYNAQLADGTPIADADVPYDEEVLWSYEGGFKSTILGGSTRLNGSLFYYDYEDYQAFVFIQSGGTVTNRDADVVGAELELQTNPIEGLDIMFSAGWFDAEVKDLPIGGNPAVAPILKDVQPTFAPELQFAGLVRYEWPMLAGRVAAQVDGNWSDEFYHNIRNFDSTLYDSYFVANARLTYTNEDDRWSVSAWVQNFTDEEYGLVGFDLSTLCGCNEDWYGKPRWFGLTARLNF
jgi:iron complex outermembrane receptor protein